MENKRAVPVWVSVILTILLVSGIVLQITMTAKYANGVPFTIVTIIDCIACIFALVYCFKGYSKNAAGFFAAFCVFYCFSLMIPIFLVAGNYQAGNISSVLILALHLIAFACASIFVVARDLGKKKSYILMVTILACTFINFIITLNSGVSISFALGMIGKVVLSIIFLIMVYAKYKDKAARGTK